MENEKQISEHFVNNHHNINNQQVIIKEFLIDDIERNCLKTVSIINQVRREDFS